MTEMVPKDVNSQIIHLSVTILLTLQVPVPPAIFLVMLTAQLSLFYILHMWYTAVNTGLHKIVPEMKFQSFRLDRV